VICGGDPENGSQSRSLQGPPFSGKGRNTPAAARRDIAKLTQTNRIRFPTFAIENP
jgi:hypothetical protein